MLASFLFAGNCGRTEHGDFIYWPKIIKSYIRLGVNDFDKDLANSKVYEIEKIIRPKKAYPSGGYRVWKIFLFIPHTYQNVFNIPTKKISNYA